jgi:hypothetical protein
MTEHIFVTVGSSDIKAKRDGINGDVYVTLF